MDRDVNVLEYIAKLLEAGNKLCEENARLREAFERADSLLSEVEVFFANGASDDGMELWSRISDFRTSTTSSGQDSPK